MRLLLLLLLPFLSIKTVAQVSADLVIGKWLKTSKEDLIIEVYRSGDEYLGRIVWTKGNDSARLKGFQILEGLKYNAGEKIWEGGTIHHPRSSGTYDATTKIRTDGTLELLAYKGLKFIGRKKYFRRVE